MPGYKTRSSRTSRPADDDDIDAITPCLLPTTETTSSSELAAASEPADMMMLGGRSSGSGSNNSSKRNSTYSDHHYFRSRSSSPESMMMMMATEDGGPVAAGGSSAQKSRRNSLKAVEEGTGGDPERLWRRMLALQQIYGCYKSARMSAALELGNISLWQPSKACLDLMNEDMEVLPEDAEEALKRATSSAPSF
ncbi:hypothetical protein BX600DRAFT_518537 [Xylariales sp. PMI_506]|nr:hypothetical protein BX600DRAFT_518537 [Xylariales sp. PMI_506]